MSRRRIVAAAVALVLAGRAVAQDAPPPAPAGGAAPPPAANPDRDPLHVAWVAFKADSDAMQAARTAKDMVAVKAAQDRGVVSQARFVAEFRKVDWKAVDAVGDRELLSSGLLFVAKEAMTAKDAKTLLRAYETYIDRLHDDRNAKFIEARGLPTAHLMNGDLAKAEAVWKRCSGSADPDVAGIGCVSLGDLLAARGDLEGARALWKRAADATVSAPRSPVAQSKGDAEGRLALVGKPAPEVDSKVWIGGPATPLSKLKGRVVVLDFWATWCPPCRDVMPELDAFAKAKAEAGLTVLGVTRVYPNGFLPTKGTKDPVKDGEAVKSIAEDAFQAHLLEYRDRTGIAYPFVTASQAEFEAYKVQGIPTLAVIDRDGNVGFVKVGSGDETLLHLAIERMLATPAKPAAPTPPTAPEAPPATGDGK